MDAQVVHGRVERLAAGRARDEQLLARSTRRMVRSRRWVLAAWLVLLIAGVIASTRLSPLLSNSFAVPGTDSARAATILQERFGDRGDGEYLVVFATPRPLRPTLRAPLPAAADPAASRTPSPH